MKKDSPFTRSWFLAFICERRTSLITSWRIRDTNLHQDMVPSLLTEHYIEDKNFATHTN
jgi:hypothetical protein